MERKKSILIFSHAMEIGGAEKALLGLLETIDTDKYDVDLFLMRHAGELLKYIPDHIRILPEKPEYASLAVPIQDVIRRRQFRVAWGRLVGKWNAKRKERQLSLSPENDVALEYSHKYTAFAMPDISEKEYDLAISFLTPHYFVTQKVRAKKKVAWIHTDYSVLDVDRESQLQMWNSYDVIASISENVTKSFLTKFPELEEKVQIIENIMPAKYMEKMSGEYEPKDEIPEDGSIRLLSIGRFCTAKNFDNVPMICKFMIDKGLNIKWYLIGYGKDEDLIKEKIKEAGMQKNVIILGKKENPYPYIKACDMYVQPSRYEGKCVSVIEAQILYKPVIITDYATAESQLKDGVDGVIVPMDNKGCAEGLAAVIRNEELQKRLVENIKRYNYSKMDEVKKIYAVM